MLHFTGHTSEPIITEEAVHVLDISVKSLSTFVGLEFDLHSNYLDFYWY